MEFVSLFGPVLGFIMIGFFMALTGFLYGAQVGFGTHMSIVNEIMKSTIDQTLIEQELYDRMVGPLSRRVPYEKDPEEIRRIAGAANIQYERWKKTKQRAIPLSLSVRLFFWRNMSRIVGVPLLVFVGIYGIHELLELFLASPVEDFGFQLLDHILSLSLPAIIGYALALGMMAINALVDRSPIGKVHFGLVGELLGVMLFMHAYLGFSLPDLFAWAFVVYHVALFAGVYLAMREVNADSPRRSRRPPSVPTRPETILSH